MQPKSEYERYQESLARKIRINQRNRNIHTILPLACRFLMNACCFAAGVIKLVYNSECENTADSSLLGNQTPSQSCADSYDLMNELILPGVFVVAGVCGMTNTILSVTQLCCKSCRESGRPESSASQNFTTESLAAGAYYSLATAIILKTRDNPNWILFVAIAETLNYGSLGLGLVFKTINKITSSRDGCCTRQKCLENASLVKLCGKAKDALQYIDVAGGVYIAIFTVLRGEKPYTYALLGGFAGSAVYYLFRILDETGTTKKIASACCCIFGNSERTKSSCCGGKSSAKYEEINSGDDAEKGRCCCGKY